MSITQGMTGGGSWSGSHTLAPFPSNAGWRSLGRGNLNLFSFATNKQIVMALVLLPFGGPLASVGRGLAIRAISLATKPVFWVGVNAFQEAEDAAAYLRGEDMSWQLGKKWRPIYGPHPMFGPVFIPVPFPYLDFTESPSSGGGGPGEIPNLRRPPPSIEETGEILSNPPIVGEKVGSLRPSTSKKAGKRRKSCPPGYRWNGRRCVRNLYSSYSVKGTSYKFARVKKG